MIISFKHGTLYMKVREELNTEEMRVSCAIVRIDRDGLVVSKGDSSLDVSSANMCLTRQELTLVVQGYEMVRHYWEESAIPLHHVLLTCGCIRRWDSLVEESTGKVKDFLKRKSVWCPEHEEVRVWRCNEKDWDEDEAS